MCPSAAVSPKPPALGDFVLHELLPSLPGIHRAHVFCADPQQVGAQVYIGAAPTDARLRFETSANDLATNPLPHAALAIGLHPQPLPRRSDRLWERIIENVVSTSPKCVFTCWMVAEAEELVGICKQLGCTCQMQRNPSPMPPAAYSMRFQYIILVERQRL